MERRRKIESEHMRREPTTGDSASFAPRVGDKLSITFAGAKLQIAPYTTVEIDSATYERTLAEGDDLEVEWGRCYGYLRRQVLAAARQKLADFADELAKAKKRADG